jgi:hypothetical protein
MTAMIFEDIKSFFEEDGWNASRKGQKTILEMDFQGLNGIWKCFADVREQTDEFLFYSILLMPIPIKRKIDVAEFITRANYGVTIGNFEMDFDDGEVRYKTNLDLKHLTLTKDLIRQYVYFNVKMMDSYLNGIMAVINEEVNAAEAIAKIEKF